MKFKVTDKHPNSHLCFVCGLANDTGLKARFFAVENDVLVATMTPCELHQSYPGRLHGGIAAAILDETAGRAIQITEPDVFGVTLDLQLEYKKPVPLDVPLRVTGKIVKNSRRLFEGDGELLLPDGTLAVKCHGRYMKMPIDKITDGQGFDESSWKTLPEDGDPEMLDLTGSAFAADPSNET